MRGFGIRLNRRFIRIAGNERRITSLLFQQQLIVTVTDNGAGLPAGFDLDSSTSLGLQIVRTLVVGELGGRLQITPRAAGGTEVMVDLPVEMPPGAQHSAG